MKISHIAIWVNDLEKEKYFYIKYFSCRSGEKYRNNSKMFESYFLSFENGAKIELMKMQEIEKKYGETDKQYIGLAHLAISVGSKEKVDQLTEKIRNDGYTVLSNPRTTGDGYYESVILDPEGNRIEIVI